MLFTCTSPKILSKLLQVTCAVFAGVLFLQQANAQVGGPDLEPKEESHLDQAAFESSPFPASTRPLPGLETFIDETVNALRQEHGVPGVTISLVYGGEIALAKGYGFADPAGTTSINPQDTLFRAASISKTITWTAVMQLVERGQINLDTDVNEYLSEFQIPKTYETPITMRHLLTHTAGFEDGFVGYLYKPKEEDLIGLAQALERHMAARVRPPGKYASYSNYGASLAGHIVANVSGRSFDTYVEENIFAPLGMTKSTFREPVPHSISRQQPIGLVRHGDEYTEFGFEFLHDFGPGGSFSTTAHDMAKFMLAHLGDGSLSRELGSGRILSADTVRLMQTPLHSAHEGLPSVLHGFYQEFINGRTAFGHNGTIHAFRARLMMLTQPRFGVFVSTNSPEGAALRTDLVAAIFGKYFPTENVEKSILPLTVAHLHLPDYVGRYRDLKRSFTKWEKISVLFGGSDFSVSLHPEGGLAISSPLAAHLHNHQLLPQGNNLFVSAQDPDLRIAFRQNPKGHVTHVFLDSLSTFQRVGYLEQTHVHLVIIGFSLCLAPSLCAADFRFLY